MNTTITTHDELAAEVAAITAWRVARAERQAEARREQHGRLRLPRPYGATFGTPLPHGADWVTVPRRYGPDGYAADEVIGHRLSDPRTHSIGTVDYRPTHGVALGASSDRPAIDTWRVRSERRADIDPWEGLDTILSRMMDHADRHPERWTDADDFRAPESSEVDETDSESARPGRARARLTGVKVRREATTTESWIAPERPSDDALARWGATCERVADGWQVTVTMPAPLDVNDATNDDCRWITYRTTDSLADGRTITIHRTRRRGNGARVRPNATPIVKGSGVWATRTRATRPDSGLVYAYAEVPSGTNSERTIRAIDAWQANGDRLTTVHRRTRDEIRAGVAPRVTTYAGRSAVHEARIRADKARARYAATQTAEGRAASAERKPRTRKQRKSTTVMLPTGRRVLSETGRAHYDHKRARARARALNGRKSSVVSAAMAMLARDRIG